MSHPGVAPRFTTAAGVLLALVVGGASTVRAQNGVAPALTPSAVAPAASEAPASAEPASAEPAQAGPRVNPTLERYQASLPQRSGSETPALDSEGGRHTIVLSTLALVLIGVIVVLLIT